MRAWVAALIAAPVAAAAQGSRIPFTAAAAASTDGHTYNITWAAPSGIVVDVFAGTNPDAIGRDHPVGHGTGTARIVVRDLPDTIRWYFALVPSRGRPLVIADRDLHLTTVSNFRDAGGYRTADGRWVRMGRVYRSGQIDQLGDLDLRTLTADHVRLVCDLRTAEERTRGPDRLPSGAESVVADVLGGSEFVATAREVFVDSAKERAVMGNGGGRRFMMEGYRRMVSSPAARAAYHALFTRLADSAELPGLFHCSGGKDRTGWGTAVLLTMLGVPRSVVVEDFLLSNTYLRARTAARVSHLGPGVDAALLEPLLEVDPGYLDAAFDEVQQRYGSFDGYLHEGLGLDDATLRALRSELLTD